MNERTVEAIVKEITPILTGQKFGKIFPLAKLRLAIDFRLFEGQYLFIGLEPGAPRLLAFRMGAIRSLPQARKSPSGRMSRIVKALH